MRRLFRTWGQRPSILCGWTDQVTGTNTTGSFVSNLALVQDALQQGNIATPIPRACRITRWAATFTYSASSGGTPTVKVGLHRSIGCAGTSLVDEVSFTAPNAGGLLNCNFGRFGPNAIYNEGDLWRIANGVGGTIVPTVSFPALRVVVFFELR